MDDTLLRERLRESEQRNEALSREVASLRATLNRVLEEFGAFRREHEALVDATRIITAERDRCGSGWRNWRPPIAAWWTCSGAAERAP